MERTNLVEAAKGIMQQMKHANLTVDCWSVRESQGKTGIATEDCDIAIDVIDSKGVKFVNTITEKDPYKKGEDMVRYKFKATDMYDDLKAPGVIILESSTSFAVVNVKR